MSRRVSSPLHPAELEEIERYVRDIDDPARQDEVRRLLLHEGEEGAARAAANRQLFRKEFAAAREAGHPNPGRHAAIQVAKTRLLEAHRSRVAGLFRAAADRSRREANKLNKLVTAASRTARPGTRRFPDRDLKFLEIVGLAEKEGRLDHSALVGNEIRTKVGKYRLPHWEKTTTGLKVMALSVVSAKEGAQTINLRLTPIRCRAALKSPRGPASYVQDRIKRSLETEFGEAPDFWLVIEPDTDDRFHVHGAVLTPNVPNAVARVDAALRRAGGRWASPGGHHFQQRSRSLDDPLYWASYCCKDINLATLVRGYNRKLLASTQRLKALAASTWDELRGVLPTGG